MELQEGLEFYRRCLKHCDETIAALYARKDLPEERKKALVDQQLDTRNMLKDTIEMIEELLR